MVSASAIVNARRLLLDVDPGEAGRPPRLVARSGDDGEQRLPVKRDLLFRKQGLVREDRRNVVPARNVRRRQDGDDPFGGAHGRKVEAPQQSARLVGHADGDMKRPLRLAKIVDVERRSLHMQARGIMRQRLMDDRRRLDEVGDVIPRHGEIRSWSARSRLRFP